MRRAYSLIFSLCCYATACATELTEPSITETSNKAVGSKCQQSSRTATATTLSLPWVVVDVGTPPTQSGDDGGAPPRGKKSKSDRCDCDRFIKTSRWAGRQMSESDIGIVACRNQSGLHVGAPIHSYNASTHDDQKRDIDYIKNYFSVWVVNVGKQKDGCMPVGFFADASPPHTMDETYSSANILVTLYPAPVDPDNPGIVLEGDELNRPFWDDITKTIAAFHLNRDAKAGEDIGQLTFTAPGSRQTILTQIPLRFGRDFTMEK